MRSSPRVVPRRAAQGPALAAVLLVGAALAGCNRGPADSSAAAYKTAQDRVAWMAGRIRGDPPSAMLDAHFFDRESKVPAGHMGPGYSMYWFQAKVRIDPRDAPAWAARTKPIAAPRWQRDSHPLLHPSAGWAMTPEEFDGAGWYDPEPLVGSRAHGGYQGGYMAITKDGQHVFVWQHWR